MRLMQPRGNYNIPFRQLQNTVEHQPSNSSDRSFDNSKEPTERTISSQIMSDLPVEQKSPSVPSVTEYTTTPIPTSSPAESTQVSEPLSPQASENQPQTQATIEVQSPATPSSGEFQPAASSMSVESVPHNVPPPPPPQSDRILDPIMPVTTTGAPSNVTPNYALTSGSDSDSGSTIYIAVFGVILGLIATIAVIAGLRHRSRHLNQDEKDSIPGLFAIDAGESPFLTAGRPSLQMSEISYSRTSAASGSSQNHHIMPSRISSFAARLHSIALSQSSAGSFGVWRHSERSANNSMADSISDSSPKRKFSALSQSSSGTRDSWWRRNERSTTNTLEEAGECLTDHSDTSM
jgi:hypothetical protein